MHLDQLDNFIVVEQEKTIDGNLEDGYLFVSNVKIHDGDRNQLVCEFNRFMIVDICNITGVETEQTTFVQFIVNELGLQNEDVNYFYNTKGVSHDFVHTVPL